MFFFARPRTNALQSAPHNVDTNRTKPRKILHCTQSRLKCVQIFRERQFLQILKRNCALLRTEVNAETLFRGLRTALTLPQNLGKFFAGPHGTIIHSRNCQELTRSANQRESPHQNGELHLILPRSRTCKQFSKHKTTTNAPTLH